MNNPVHIRRRSMRLSHVLTWCSDWHSEQEGLIDLLTDSMHWCDQNGEDFHIALAQACRHYVNELNSNQHDERRLPSPVAQLESIRDELADEECIHVPSDVIDWLDERIDTLRSGRTRLNRSPAECTTMPPDPEGLNADRATWAGYALEAFISQTGTEHCDAATDLLCNLMHLADRDGTDFEATIERARMHYEAETASSQSNTSHQPANRKD